MLRKIPDSAIPFARDGVIAASTMGLAEYAERLQHYAQKRASRTLADAQQEADELRAMACQAGYREGMEHALAAVVPRLMELLADEATLKAQARAAVEVQVRAALTDVGIESALVARCCLAETGDEANAGAWTLYVPDDRGDLLERLSKTLGDGLRIRAGEGQNLVLERGDRVIEFDTTQAPLRALSIWLDEQTMTEALQQRALDYATQVQRTLRDSATRSKLASHKYEDEIHDSHH